MLEITRLTVEHLAQGCVTDCPAPRIGFAVQSDRNDAELTDAILQVGDWNVHLPQDGQTGHRLQGAGAAALYDLRSPADSHR